MTSSKTARFPLGGEITLHELDQDPYPVFARLRDHEPISWVPALNMWFVMSYDDVRTALFDTARLTTASPQSTIFDTFGAHMLTTEGATHDRYREAAKGPFTPRFIRSHWEAAIRAAAITLVEGFQMRRQADLRTVFAARLPIQVMLRVCGLPLDAEPHMRRWYDSFETALANFSGDPAVREAARSSVGEFHALLDEAIDSIDPRDEHSLLAFLLNACPGERLNNEEIKRNLSIIFFGGISTVEALTLNSLWALFEHPDALERVRSNPATIPQAIEETMRWLSPVQSATRHVAHAFEWQGIEFSAHETVNCMLGAANRDPVIFTDPERFDLGRANSRRHLGFATGAHACLGSQLAKAEVRVALETLLATLRNMRLERSLTPPPTGYEFRQPRNLVVSWDC
ncbi:MAG TPA: cytochrome P450 [Steroidobacteraceae bacterium]|nr:cytochrome P450 [Steroidobacteraceae bacterium]